MITKKIIKEEYSVIEIFCGINNRNIKKIEDITGKKIFIEGNEIIIDDDNNSSLEKLLVHLINIIKSGGTIHKNMIQVLHNEINSVSNDDTDYSDFMSNTIEIKKVNKVLNPRTINQARLIQFLNEKDVIFTYGPAGTGKTFLSIAYGLNQLLSKNIKKLILTRPVVEAGENLGFLPGDYIQKINPYLIPLFDAINQIITAEIISKLESQNMIEIAPLAYMRGRTFEDAIVILDEAQNTTTKQMKMFLTRLGKNSKLIVNGDISQIDLPHKLKSGLVEAIGVLKHVDEIGILEFDENDVVRHELVKKIVKAYKDYENI